MTYFPTNGNSSAAASCTGGRRMYVLFRTARTEADRDSPQVNNSFEAFECDTITYQGLQQHPELLGAVRIFIWHSRLPAWLQLDDGSLAACQQQDPEKISLLVLKAAAPTAAVISQVGSLAERELYVNVLLEHEDKQVEACLLVDTGCTMALNMSEYKAQQLDLPLEDVRRGLEMGQGHEGGVTRRGSLLTTVVLETEDGASCTSESPSAWLEVWTDDGTGPRTNEAMATTPTKSSSRRGSAGDNGSPKSLTIKVLSPIRRGKDSQGHDAILGSLGIVALGLGIDKETHRLYRKVVRHRKVKKLQANRWRRECCCTATAMSTTA